MNYETKIVKRNFSHTPMTRAQMQKSARPKTKNTIEKPKRKSKQKNMLFLGK